VRNFVKNRIISKYRTMAEEYGIPVGILIRDFYRHYYTISLVKKYAPAHTHRRILDVSAGFAIPSRNLLDESYLIEVTDSQLFAGERMCKINKRDFVFHNIDNLETDDLPFEACTFDVVLWLGTIEHLHNSPKRILEWFYKILRNGGVLIIDTPNILELRKRIMLFFGKSFMPPIQFLYNSNYNSDHHREYTKGDLEYVVKLAQFKILKSTIIDTISGISIDKRIKINERKVSQLSEMTQFRVGFQLSNRYDYIKIPYSFMVKLIPSLRDTLFIVCEK